MNIKINKNIMAIVLVLAIFGSMSVTKALGLWSDKDGLTKAVEVAKKELSNEAANTFNLNNETGDEVKLNISVTEIKGSSTFGQVSEVYGVALDDLITAFALDTTISADTKIKDLATIFRNEDSNEGNIGTASVRYFVALYVGEEFINNEEYLPQSAVKLLNELNKLSNDAKEYLSTHTVNK